MRLTSATKSTQRDVLMLVSWALLGAILTSTGCKTQAGDSSGVDSRVGARTPSDKVRALHAPAGDVALLVQSERAQAVVEDRQLVVYVGATWCEPCQKFHHAVELGELDSIFPRLTLVEFDLDEDHERLANAGYFSNYIPLFAIPKGDGTASGRQVEGGIKGDGAVGFITTKLKELLAQKE